MAGFGERGNKMRTMFVVKSEEPSRRIVELSLVNSDGPGKVWLTATADGGCYRLALFVPGEPLQLSRGVPLNLDMPVDDKGHICTSPQ